MNCYIKFDIIFIKKINLVDKLCVTSFRSAIPNVNGFKLVCVTCMWSRMRWGFDMRCHKIKSISILWVFYYLKIYIFSKIVFAVCLRQAITLEHSNCSYLKNNAWLKKACHINICRIPISNVFENSSPILNLIYFQMCVRLKKNELRLSRRIGAVTRQIRFSKYWTILL